MKTLSSELKPISEKTAKKLAKAFRKNIKVNKDDFLPNISDILAVEIGNKFLSQLNVYLYNKVRYNKASYLTKWYWKKRVVKNEYKLTQITACINVLQKSSPTKDIFNFTVKAT